MEILQIGNKRTVIKLDGQLWIVSNGVLADYILYTWEMEGTI